MWSVSLICNLNFTLSLSKISGEAFVTFRMFIESDLKDPLSQANVEFRAIQATDFVYYITLRQ